LALNALTAAAAAPPVVTPPGTIFLLAMRVTALSIASSSPMSFDPRAFKSPISVLVSLLSAAEVHGFGSCPMSDWIRKSHFKLS
jgi:hypothetical protein